MVPLLTDAAEVRPGRRAGPRRGHGALGGTAVSMSPTGREAAFNTTGRRRIRSRAPGPALPARLSAAITAPRRDAARTYQWRIQREAKCRNESGRDYRPGAQWAEESPDQPADDWAPTHTPGPRGDRGRTMLPTVAGSWMGAGLLRGRQLLRLQFAHCQLNGDLAGAFESQAHATTSAATTEGLRQRRSGHRVSEEAAAPGRGPRAVRARSRRSWSLVCANWAALGIGCSRSVMWKRERSAIPGSADLACRGASSSKQIPASRSRDHFDRGRAGRSGGGGVAHPTAVRNRASTGGGSCGGHAGGGEFSRPRHEALADEDSEGQRRCR